MCLLDPVQVQVTVTDALPDLSTQSVGFDWYLSVPFVEIKVERIRIDRIDIVGECDQFDIGHTFECLAVDSFQSLADDHLSDPGTTASRTSNLTCSRSRICDH